jgi:hypothetical protein
LAVTIPLKDFACLNFQNMFDRLEICPFFWLCKFYKIYLTVFGFNRMFGIVLVRGLFGCSGGVSPGPFPNGAMFWWSQGPTGGP